MVTTVNNSNNETEEKFVPAVAKPRMSHGILSLVLPDKQHIYDSFMPFVKGGGLFIATNRVFHLGEEVFALIQIMDDTDKTPITGKVIWLTPKAPQHNRRQGIGIQISPEDNELTQRLETYLAGADIGAQTQTL